MRSEAALAGRAGALPLPARPLARRAARAGGRAPARGRCRTRRSRWRCWWRARSSSRLDLQETRDQVDDARRSASLARQNLLPQLDLNLGVSQGRAGPALRRAPGARATRASTCSSPPRTRWSAPRTAAGKAVAELELARAHARAARSASWRSRPRCARAVRDLDQIRKSVELQKTGRSRSPQQQHRLATLRYQRGLASQLRRGGRGGQPGAGPQRAGGPAHALPGRARRAAARHRHASTWSAEFAP